ncbi:DUF2142 domain-containing protein [Dactylosporangium sp. NPDC051485]|uniref:DUF2142 domain-containing protein n=1 Tax=Dactylosporangium sp. NPDC051485 TaxID=3154846 RepID=UPI0034400A83
MPRLRTRPRFSSRTLLALFFVGYFAVAAGWALATPYNGAADELPHVVRAAGVVRGQIAPAPVDAVSGTGAYQTVPKSLVRPKCWQQQPTVPASCDHFNHDDRTPVRTPTTAGRYNPAYYAVVGLPLLIWPSMKGLLLARLIDAALVAGLLTLAFSAVLRWFTNRAGVAAIVLMTTPTVLSLAGAVNPSSVEMAAGILLFAALIPLAHGKLAAEPRMVHYAGVASLVLLTVRAAGPLWLAAGAFALLVPNRWAHIRALLRMRTMQIWLGVLAAAGVASLAWTLAMRTLSLMYIDPQSPPFTYKQALEVVVLQQWGTYLQQMVAAVSWLDVPIPTYVFAVWLVALGGLLMPALVVGPVRDRYRIVIMVVIAWTVPTITDPVNANLHGFPTQGRYLLPLFVGAPLLAAEILGREGVLTAARSRTMAGWIAFVVMPVVHLTVLAATMVRWQSGIAPDPMRPHFNPFNGVWHPQAGSVVPFVAVVLGLVAIALASWVATSPSGTRGNAADETVELPAFHSSLSVA